MWREMHVKTDVFCAGSVILPDKAGRQINVGGWSLESTFGVRLYTPDGHEGVNSTNDWEENFQVLSLQVVYILCWFYWGLSSFAAWPMVPDSRHSRQWVYTCHWRGDWE